MIKDELKCEKYINDKRFTVEVVQLLFKMRTRMDPAKSNFKKQHEPDLFCDLCRISLCTPQHQLSCVVMRKFVPDWLNTDVVYEDIFGDVNKQLIAIRIFMKVARQKEVILDALRK